MKCFWILEDLGYGYKYGRERCLFLCWHDKRLGNPKLFLSILYPSFFLYAFTYPKINKTHKNIKNLGKRLVFIEKNCKNLVFILDSDQTTTYAATGKSIQKSELAQRNTFL